MRVSVSWLKSLVDLPEDVATSEIAARLTKAGLQVERIEQLPQGVCGPVKVGKVLEFVVEPQKNGKQIRWCQVDLGEGEPRGIICGADNFSPGDYVVVALPGAELPGGFKISARKTYGHISDGMICAEDELGLGEDHAGIIVLNELETPSGARVDDSFLGSDALELLQARDEVFEIDVTPDIGYCLSMRGIARETAQAFGVDFKDPYSESVPEPSSAGYPVKIESENCQLFVALSLDGFNPEAKSPLWMQRRIQASGMRSISLAVDITNYVMLESGQPLHAYDRDSLSGAIRVRQASAGERLTTLDGVDRELMAEDLLITDDSGPIGLAGVMGGQHTELEPTTTNIVIEAAIFAPVTISRTFRRHKLPSEASKRFERAVDPGVAYAAGLRAAELIVSLGGAQLSSEVTVVGQVEQPPSTKIAKDLPAKVLGVDISASQVEQILKSSGVEVESCGDDFVLTPPTWRTDLRAPYDYVEDVGRKIGFDQIPATLPIPPAGLGYTFAQRAKRSVSRAVADLGFVEVITLPFIGDSQLDSLGLAADDERRQVVRLANPLDDTEPYLRSTLLPGLFAAVLRNTSRSQNDLALFELGSVFIDRSNQGEVTSKLAAPMFSVETRPSEDQYAQLNDSLPTQPKMLAAVLSGNWAGPSWGIGDSPVVAPATWANAIEFAEVVGRTLGISLERRAGNKTPWHPGRCAEFFVGDTSVGFAGELHPSVCQKVGLPNRCCAVELNLGALIEAAPRNGEISELSPYPVTKEDVALIVDESVSADDLAKVLRTGCGELLESVSLFDVYRSSQLGDGKKSLAFSLGFRAKDRTLNEEEAMAALEKGVALAGETFGAFRRA